MDLNFKNLNCLPLYPTLVCENKTGPGDESLMINPVINSIGEIKISAHKDSKKSSALLINLNVILEKFENNSLLNNRVSIIGKEIDEPSWLETVRFKFSTLLFLKLIGEDSFILKVSFAYIPVKLFSPVD